MSEGGDVNKKQSAGLCAGVAAVLAVSVSAALAAAGGATAEAPQMIPPDPSGVASYALTSARPASRFVDRLAAARAATAKYADDLPRAKGTATGSSRG